MNETTIELLESTSNMLRGMCMDPRIPQDTKEALWSRVCKLDAATEAALDNEAGESDLHDMVRKPEQAEPVAWMTHGNDQLPLFHKTKAGALAWGAEPQPLYTAPPQRKQAEPQSTPATPAWWRDGLTATLMREGINKHRAREIADGYWDAYCGIDGLDYE